MSDKGDMTAREQRVRDCAERLWNESGQPTGQDEKFWYQAELEIDAEDATPRPSRAR